VAASRPDGPAGGRLGRYHAKRDFARTPEPRGGTGGKRKPRRGRGLSFVVQKHAARRLHYDLRLELDGVLKSWAVPQGPSLDRGERRLAVHVEDHPLDYDGFEGAIPKGEYGGGTVMLWDRGTWEAVGDPAQDYAAGKLKFRLRGMRLQGGWTLVRMGGKAKDKDLWLLSKERDEHASTDKGSGDDRSAISGRTMEEIAADPERVWHGNRSETSAAQSPVKRGRRSALPFVPPQLATLAASAPAGQEWLHEIKHDGYRVQLHLQDGTASLLTRNGHDWTHRFRNLPHMTQDLPGKAAVIDGEVVVLDERGVSSFARLKAVLSAGSPRPLVFFAFDLLHLDGRDLRDQPLLERKRRLERLLAALPPDHPIRYCDHLIGSGRDLHRQACRLGAEGIIAKRVDVPYRSGRNEDWLKVKCYARQEFVIGGYTTVKGRGLGLGSLVLGVHRDGALAYVGRVGTGWDARSGQELRDALDPLRVDQPPFARLPAAARRGARWVRPELVAEVQFQTWTADGMLRHASFQGLREDRAAAEVVPEHPKPVIAARSPGGLLELQGCTSAVPTGRCWIARG
jgi:bifunctional non-homologous end joining protein LigD